MINNSVHSQKTRLGRRERPYRLFTVRGLQVPNFSTRLLFDGLFIRVRLRTRPFRYFTIGSPRTLNVEQLRILYSLKLSFVRSSKLAMQNCSYLLVRRRTTSGIQCAEEKTGTIFAKSSMNQFRVSHYFIFTRFSATTAGCSVRCDSVRSRP